MLSYILETARDVYENRSDADLDEVAAVAGVKVGIVRGYFATAADLRLRVMLTAAECGPRPASAEVRT